MNASLSKIHRLKKRKDFLRIQRSGLRVQSKFLTLVAKSVTSKNEGRVGLTVSKAVGKAHVRNFVKRRLRHVLRESKELFKEFDLVVIAHPAIVSISFEILKADLLNTLQILRQKFLSKSNKMEKPS